MPFKKGHKLGKGRPKKADEDKANTLFLNALKIVYSKDDDDDAKVAFIKDKLMASERGQLFIAEHLFGKPTEKLEVKQIESLPIFNINE